MVQQYVAEQEAPPRAAVVGTAMRTSPSLAALANGVSGHAEDYDDTQLSTTPDRVYGLLTHPTVPVLAAALAVAEETGASGAAFLAALGTGIEVSCKLAEAISPAHYMQGFHTTGTVGVFGATAAAAQLRGLTAEQTRFALGIAASKGAGLRANFGTMTKPYHAGAAAENGVVASRLAALGYQADPNALDGQWGFFQVTGGGAEPDRVLGRLGRALHPRMAGRLRQALPLRLAGPPHHGRAARPADDARRRAGGRGGGPPGRGEEHPPTSAIPVAAVGPGGKVQPPVLPGDTGAATPAPASPSSPTTSCEAPMSGR